MNSIHVHTCILIGILFFASCGEELPDSAHSSNQPQSQITPAPTPPPPPAPDGIICYVTCDVWDRNDAPQLTLINTDGSGYFVLTCLASAQLSNISDVCWSPDASRIALIGERGGISSVFIVQADNSGFTKITDDEYGKLDICWSPVGEYIAYKQVISTGLFSSDVQICVVSADGREVNIVTRASDNAGSPSWSQDGQVIFYESQQIVKSVNYDGTPSGISEEDSRNLLLESQGKVVGFDYVALSSSFESGGEISINTPYWAYSETYLSLRPSMSGPYLLSPNGDIWLGRCRIEADDYFCKIDPLSYSITIVEPPAVDSWNSITSDYIWINDNQILFFGKRENKEGFCKLNVNTGQLQWVVNSDSDRRLFDIKSWAYVSL